MNGEASTAGSPDVDPPPSGHVPPSASGPDERDEARLARVALMRAADAGDALMGRLVDASGPVEAVSQIRRGLLASEVRDGLEGGRSSTSDLRRRLDGWRARLLAADPARDLATGRQLGARLISPGEVEWPTQLDDLRDNRPLGLWVHGSADLRYSCLRSISVVGARAATAYGTHVAAAFGAELSDAGWTVVSGGAYGIDGAAHRGALAGQAPTVVVLACGTDFCYPSAHQDLFAAVRDQGVVISECPPGVHPTRSRFLVRNRLIAALSRGTLVVEAALRSGALNTVNHALALRRHVGAVPGPITSEASHGCHHLLRQGKAQCVTSGEEAIDLVGVIGDDLARQRRGPVVPRDTLSSETRCVLDAIPARGGAGPATIAVAAGIPLESVLSCLGNLAAAGYIQRTPKGWRILTPP